MAPKIFEKSKHTRDPTFEPSHPSFNLSQPKIVAYCIPHFKILTTRTQKVSLLSQLTEEEGV